MPFTLYNNTTMNAIKQPSSTLSNILEHPFQNPIGRYKLDDHRMKTVHSISINKKELINIKIKKSPKLLWINKTTNQVYLLGLYEESENSPILKKIFGDGPDNLDTTTGRDDPDATAVGYGNKQAIFDFTVTLHRDHIIPYDKIMSFANTILEYKEHTISIELKNKIDSWIKQALVKYCFNLNSEKEKIKEKINGTTLEKIYSDYKCFFDKEKIKKEDLTEEKILNTILKYLYELDSATFPRVENLIKLKKDLHDDGIQLSSFFTDDVSGLYIDVNSVIDRFKNNSFSDKDEVVIKRAIGWMPGNVFLAPYPKPQDTGNVFDCTVAAAQIEENKIHELCSAYNAMIDFNRDSGAVEKALDNLSKIANYSNNFWPFIYGNWKYYSIYDNTFFYPYQIFDIEKGKIELEYNEEIPICKVLDERFLRNHTNLSGQ